MKPDAARPGPGRGRGKALPALVVTQLIVAVVALAILIFVATKIGPLLNEKAQLEADITGYRKEVASLQAGLKAARSELAETRQRLRDTVDMARYMHRIDPVDLKVIFSRFPRQARALQLILKLKNKGVGWHLGGQTPAVGFDSPTFAMYIMKQLGLPGGRIAQGDTLLATSRRLFKSLQPSDRPVVGDLAFYPAGYVLFYFKDKDNKPFVIGMTPAGIAALDPGFASPLGYRKSGLGG